MRFCGVIAEYNPFHNGHAFHILQSRALTGADYVVCAMSGSFVQRGETAVFDKWTRTACALLGGADVVIELPLLYAVQSAEGFARGGIAVLEAAGAKTVSFGCETDDIAALTSIAKTLNRETRHFKKTLRQHLDSGISFPKARMMAAFPEAGAEISMPNAILGIEYIRALLKRRSKMIPYAIKRMGSAYHDTDANTKYASATAIRKAFLQGHQDTAYAAMPDACADYLRTCISAGMRPVMPNAFDDILIFKLRMGGPAYIKNLPDVSEGLENRIYEASKISTSRTELIDKIKTKRYTYTRISRILLYALLGITKEMLAARNKRKIDHIRVLGARNADVLSALSQSSTVPLVTGSAASSAVAGIDISASDVYAMTQVCLPYNAASRDYTQKLILTNQL